nr:reverse transcriptase domain-containing protein [Tanacetum cinerariifolium]
DGTDTSLLHKPCVTRSEIKLLTNGKASIITGLCSKKASKIFSGTSYRVIEEEGPTWMTELVNYLKEGTLPADEKEARKIRLKARQYELMEGILYKRSFLTPWLRCMGPLQAEYIIKEIHEGSCSMHAGPRSVVAKAIQLGYFWLTMHRDAQDMIRKCNDCQTSETSERMGGGPTILPLTRTPKEIFAAESGKFKPAPPMLRKQIEELVRASKLSHFIKEIRQDRDQQKTRKKDAPVKDKAATIYMIQPWQRVMRQKVTQSFARAKEITFPPLTANKGIEGPLVIEAEIGGHVVHRIYVDGGSSMEVLYEHCFNLLRSKIKSQMVPATTLLIGFSGETIWPLRQLRLLVTIGDARYYTKAWMNFMIVRLPSPYNGIIGRPGIREIQVVPSTAHEMLKFPVNGGIVTIRSTILMPTECATIAATPKYFAKRLKHIYSHGSRPTRREYHDRLPSIDLTSKKEIPQSDRKKRTDPGARQGNPSRGLLTLFFLLLSWWDKGENELGSWLNTFEEIRLLEKGWTNTASPSALKLLEN